MRRVRSDVGGSSEPVDPRAEEETGYEPSRDFGTNAIVVELGDGAGKRPSMNSAGLFLVKELSANIEAIDDFEDLSEYSMFRKHTLKLLRYYFKLSLDYGRIPSVLGGRATRARVSHKKMYSIEDETIFLHDMNRCMEQELSETELRIVALVVFMDHTFEQTGAILQYCEKQVRRIYPHAIDRLTRAFCERELLDSVELMKGKKKPMGRARVDDLNASASMM